MYFEWELKGEVFHHPGELRSVHGPASFLSSKRGQQAKEKATTSPMVWKIPFLELQSAQRHFFTKVNPAQQPLLQRSQNHAAETQKAQVLPSLDHEVSSQALFFSIFIYATSFDINVENIQLWLLTKNLLEHKMCRM